MIKSLNILDPSGLVKKTISRCPECLAEIEAEVHRRGSSIVMTKSCPQHGSFETTLASDDRFYYHASGAPENACCCDPEQSCAPTVDRSPDVTAPFEILSTCIALIEIVDSCNLTCPTCYASSPWGIDEKVDCLSFEEFVNRVEGVLDRKGHIDILQLSGGEPTIHPEFFRLLDWSLQQKRIDYLLINTNAVRVARDGAFRERLGESRRRYGKFEMYVQFDGPQLAEQFALRGADLREVRRKAIDLAGELGVPSTLAMVVTPKTLPHVGDTLRFGLERRHCRGICLQPMFNSGRTHLQSNSLPVARHAPNPISVGDIIQSLVNQCPDLLHVADFTPLPCGDPNCHTIGYLLRTPVGTVGLSKLVDLSTLQGFLKDRVNYSIEDLAQCGCDSDPLGQLIKQFEIGPDQPFRMFIKPFMDAWTYDQDRIDRCCTHVIRPDGKLDSFCRYYLSGGAPGLELK